MLAAFVITATIIAALVLARSEMYARATTQLQSIIHAKEELLESILSTRREQVATLASAAEMDAIPQLTQLIGFQGLFTVSASGEVAVLAGESPSADMLRAMVVLRGRSTQLIPLVSKHGWQMYAIAAPTNNGRLVAVFSAQPLVDQMLNAEELGNTTDVLLTTQYEGQLLLLHRLRGAAKAGVLDLGGFESRLSSKMPLAKAVAGSEGIEEALDYAGIRVLTAYRSLPSIGWGLVVQIDTHEIDFPLAMLAAKLLFAGIVLMLLSALTMYCLAYRITEPLQDLTRKLDGLEAKRWHFARSIHTGNELERLDAAAFDLTGRLRQSHDHLEELVRVRTKALLEQHAQDDAILQNIEYGLIVTDAEGTVTLLNDAARLLTGWTREESEGKDCATVLCICDREGKPMESAAHPVRSVLASKQKYAPTQDQQLTLRRKDGTSMPLSLRATPVLRGWHCSGVVAIFRDITEDRRIDRMKSEFISLVSHQLRTPLSSMRWYLEMLLSKDAGALNEDQQSYVEQVATSNERMVRLVNALLNVSRIELGTLSAANDTVAPATLANDVVSVAQAEAAKRQIRIALDVGTRTPAALRTDEVLLRLIMENLLANAIKYGNEGSAVRVELSAKDQALVLQVRDTGIGIPPEEQHKVFSKLFRAKNAQSTNTDGNGLGLYISQIAAEAIGGVLTFTSEKGVTVFTLTLPPAPAPEAGTAAVPQQ